MFWFLTSTITVNHLIVENTFLHPRACVRLPALKYYLTQIYRSPSRIRFICFSVISPSCLPLSSCHFLDQPLSSQYIYHLFPFHLSCSSCASLSMSRPINQKGELPRANTLKHSRSHTQSIQTTSPAAKKLCEAAKQTDTQHLLVFCSRLWTDHVGQTCDQSLVFPYKKKRRHLWIYCRCLFTSLWAFGEQRWLILSKSKHHVTRSLMYFY